MSIINDALKKTQGNLKKTNETPDTKQNSQNSQEPINIYEKLHKPKEDRQNTQTPGTNQIKKTSDTSSPQKKSAKELLKNFAVIILCLLCIAGSFFFISRYEPLQKFVPFIKKGKFIARRYIPKKSQKRQRYSSGRLVLNGTSLIDGKRVALINDEIYEVGDIINGKKITGINLNQVDLNNNGKTLTLKVH